MDGSLVDLVRMSLIEHHDVCRSIAHSGRRNDLRFLDGDILKSVVFPAAQASEPAIELVPEPNQFELSNTQWIRSFHGPVSDTGFYFGKDLKVRGRGILVLGDRYLRAPDLMAEYVRKEIEAGVRTEAYANDIRKPLHLPGLTVLLGSEGYPIYGHWLVDILPKCWLWQTCFGEQAGDARFLFGADIPAFGFELLETFFDIPRSSVHLYDIVADEPLLERAVIPSLMHNSHVFHPAMQGAVSYLLERCGIDVARRPPGHRKIYVSRARFRDRSISSRRAILNEHDIMDVAESLGVEIVYPEELSIVDQVKLFSEASLVIGENGSGLHNTLFSPPGTVTLCFQPGTQVQATIAALLDQKVVFLCPEAADCGPDAATFSLDPARFRKALEFCIARAGEG